MTPTAAKLGAVTLRECIVMAVTASIIMTHTLLSLKTVFSRILSKTGILTQFCRRGKLGVHVL